ncbi:MAG: type I glyceraldehyde-3-phosphate dehydrogenase [Candidatus Korarchaeota archaeon]
MKKKVAINGFGRIGRIVFRTMLSDEDFWNKFELVAINDLGSMENAVYLLKYDSVFRPLPYDVSSEGDYLVVKGMKIKKLAEKDPANLPWKSMGVDYVVEATGAFTSRDGAMKHITAGAKRVIITAPAKNPDITIAYGVNMDLYDPSKHYIISMASCTTNSLAPIVKVLHENFGIVKGLMTTVHAYTNDQRNLDLAHPEDRRRGRASALNIVPTTTGAARAIGEVIPELKGKLDGIAVRVPVPDGSLTDFTAVLSREVTKDEINNAFKAAAKGKLAGVLKVVEDPIVSTDILGDPHPSIVDLTLTKVLGEKSDLVKVFAWYDNEYGYSDKIKELLKFIASKEPA